MPDVITNYLDQNVLEISGSLGTGTIDSKKTNGMMKLDKN